MLLFDQPNNNMDYFFDKDGKGTQYGDSRRVKV
jgi:hypothetical protein